MKGWTLSSLFESTEILFLGKHHIFVYGFNPVGCAIYFNGELCNSKIFLGICFKISDFGASSLVEQREMIVHIHDHFAKSM